MAKRYVVWAQRMAMSLSAGYYVHRGGANFARNGICKERGWKLQGKVNSKKGPKIRTLTVHSDHTD